MANDRLGLVLTGGGARAAYQVGVLSALSALFPGLEYPFKVIIGTSAGAINAMSLAGARGQLRHAVDKLENHWSEIHPDQIYRADVLGLSSSMTRFLQSAFTGEPGVGGPAMLNNKPLLGFLKKVLDIKAMQEAIALGLIRAVGVNACGYSTGRNVCFYQATDEVSDWNHQQRCGQRCELSLEHVMASAAIPTLFPPVKLGHEYFGDGVTRQMAHLSPAIHLGATRLIAIGLNANRGVRMQLRKKEEISMPNMGQVMENVLNGMFMDTLEYDIERLELINHFLQELPPERNDGLPREYRLLPMLEISPSVPVFEVARKYLNRLPGLIRRALGRNLEKGEGGISIASYLLFDKDFCRELIRLGYQDAQAHAKDFETLLENR